jgi:hypothetical protein
MGDGRSPSCLSKLKHTCYRNWNEEKRHTRVSDQYVKWDEDFFEKVFLEVWQCISAVTGQSEVIGPVPCNRYFGVIEK